MAQMDIAAVIAAIPQWRGRPVEAEPVSGGLTNRAFRVRVAGRDHFVSIPGVHSELLAIPRAQEIHNTMAAAETGVSPRVLYQLPESGVIVIEFLRGRTLKQADMQDPGMPERLAAAVRTLHTARPFANDFDLFRLTDSYREIVGSHRLLPPEGFDAYRPLLAEMEAAAREHPLPPLPCSNDLVPENLIEDGPRLWIVDFGYSGNNDPCSELGNACCEADYDQAQYEALAGAYFGRPETKILARMHLYAVMSDIAWSLWSVIQEHISTLEVDFHSYGRKRWERARRILESTERPRWIQQARHSG